MLPFEQAFERLTIVIDSLQDGKLPLDQALQQYEEGVKLAQHCKTLLQQAELTVQQLDKDRTGNWSSVPLNLS